VVDDGSNDGTSEPVEEWRRWRACVLRDLDLRENDFAFEREIIGKVPKRKLRVYELPISYYGCMYAERKKITWRDGFQAIWVLLRVRSQR
jgi:hypothetical protein